jgi:hypothetical protein
MTRHIIAACGALAIAGMAAGVSAQSTSQTTPPRQAADSGHTMTVTGCLKSWDGQSSPGATSPTGTPGETRQAGEAKYVLTDVQMTASGTDATDTTPGTAARSGSTDPHHQFLVRAEDASVDLTNHLNQRVEVTGRMSGEDHRSHTGATGTDTTPGTAGQRTDPAGSKDMPTLTVTSVRTVAGSCS